MVVLLIKKSSIILPRRNPLGIIDIPVIFWSPVPSTHTLPATGDFPSEECSARWITPRAARGSRGARSKHTVWLNRSKKLGRSSPGGRGVPPPRPGGPPPPPGGSLDHWSGPPGGPPSPPGGGGGAVRSFGCARAVPRGTPPVGGGTPGGCRDPKKGGSRGGSKSAQNICQKKGN